MREKLLIALLIAVAGIAELYPEINAQDAAGKAQELIALARKSLGGEKLTSLQTLTAEGAYRRTMGEMEMTGDLVFEMALPDKMLKIETMRPFGDVEINRLEALNGDNVWEDQQQSGGGGNMVMIRRGGRGGDPQQEKELLRRMIRAEFARLSLGLTLAAPAGFPVEFNYVGEAEAPEGKADVLDLNGENNFKAKLFLDQKTHRPLMISYLGRKPVVMTRRAMGGPPSEEEIKKNVKEDEEKAVQAPEVEFQIRFSEYKSVSGVMLPHKISKGIDNQTNEEIEFSKYKLNAPIKPEKFIKK